MADIEIIEKIEALWREELLKDLMEILTVDYEIDRSKASVISRQVHKLLKRIEDVI